MRRALPRTCRRRSAARSRRSLDWFAITTPAGGCCGWTTRRTGRWRYRTFRQIANEAVERWPGARLAIHHRTGRVDIGEASVVIAAASPHRAEAFSACRYAIERVKQIAPVWKHEHFDGGDVWIEGASADPHDDAARQLAFERACS